MAMYDSLTECFHNHPIQKHSVLMNKIIEEDYFEDESNKLPDDIINDFRIDYKNTSSIFLELAKTNDYLEV